MDDLSFLLSPLSTVTPVEPTEAERQMMEYHDAKVANAAPKAQGRIDRAEVRARCGRAMQRKLPTDMHCINEAREWAIIGGGPSINSQVDKIRELQKRGVSIVTVNKSHDWALERGIVPWAQVLLDPKPWVSEYVKRPRKDVRYFVSSQCHDSVFEALKDYPVFLWHAGQDFENGITEPTNFLEEHYPPGGPDSWHVVPGSTTVGMRAVFLGHNLFSGVDVFHMFGLDSSSVFGHMHGYDKPPPYDARPGTFYLPWKGKTYKFRTNSHMSRQLDDFKKLIDELPASYASGRIRKAFKIKFYGSGLLPFYAALLGLHGDPACNEDPARVGGNEIEQPKPGINEVPDDMLEFMKSVTLQPVENQVG